MRRRTLNLVLGAALVAPFLGSVAGGRSARAADIDVKAALAPRIQGNPDAKVTLVEYFSMTCGHCAHFHKDIYPQIKAKYIDTGLINMEYRDFPLDGVALRASAMARCAPGDRYFPLIDVLMKTQDNWVRANDKLAALEQIGRLAGLSSDLVRSCMTNSDILDGIGNSRLDGQRKYDINSTPSFLLGDQKISGAVPFEEFDELIAKALDKAG